MKRVTKGKLSKLLDNNKIVFAIAFLASIAIWFYVVVNVSPETTNTIKGVKVQIDNTIPSQFGLEVFGDSEFYVDVEVKGKKYLISSQNLSAEDIVIVAQTNNVDSAGFRTLTLKPEVESSNYTITHISQKSVDVYFDTPKTIQMVIEPEIIANGFDIVKDGFNTGDVKLSESAVTVTGPSTEINKITKAVARLELTESLSSNKSVETSVTLLDENNKSNFKYVKTNLSSVVLTIPVLRVKEVNTSVLFKNAPDEYVLNPLHYTVSPSKDYFNISVDEFEKTVDFAVGTIDLKSVSPSNYVFEFSASDLPVAEESKTEKFVVKLDVSNLSQEYFVIPASQIHANNPSEIGYKISGLNKSVVIVGTEKALDSITADKIKVEADVSAINISAGQSITIPVNVTVDSTNCWVYGSYTVEISL